jgi:hypothetical protein
VVRTTNGGTTWSVLAQSTFSSRIINSIVPTSIASDGTVNTQVVLASTLFDGGVYRSTDGGTSFTQISGSNGLPDGGVSSLVADPSLLSIITLNLEALQGITSVTGELFNGQDRVASGTTETYTVTAKSGATQVDTHNFSLSTTLSSASSVTNFSLSSTSALPITMVTFTTPNAGTNGWDFLVDTIVAQGVAVIVPEPSTIVMGSTALLLGLACGWRRLRPAAA